MSERAFERACRERRALAAFVVLVASLLFSGTAGAGTDGGSSCGSSSDCAPPSPYCEASTHRCVECLSERNCPSGMVCDTATGVCTECLSDADCSGLTPYCGKSQRRCVECVSAANCGNFGLSCTDGQCGSCGDGICAPKEGIYFDQSFFSGPFPGPFPGPIPASSGGRISCIADCGSQCPTKDIGNTLGKFTVAGTGLHDIFSSSCSQGQDGVEATFAWTAPRADTFAFTGSGVSVMILTGGCSAPGGGGCSSGFPNDAGQSSATTEAQLGAGDHVVVVVDTGSTHTDSISLVISKGTPQCGFFGCPPVTGDGGGLGVGGGGNDQGASLCVSNAQARGETMCAGVECACHHCPQDYDDCGVIPGCGDIRECMRTKNCVGTECYNSGACRNVIDSFSGVSGPAFRASARVQSCTLTFACGLPCGLEGGAPDAEAPRGAADAGRLCEPGRAVACSCEGGSGTKTCAADGSGFGACSCASASPKGSGCGCMLGARSPPNVGSAAGLLVAFAFGMAGRRATRRSRKKEVGS